MGADDEGRQLVLQLQSIRERMSGHASRHPRRIDLRTARAELETAITIAIQAGSKPHSESAATLWLGYIIDDYARIVRADAANMAQTLFG